MGKILSKNKKNKEISQTVADAKGELEAVEGEITEVQKQSGKSTTLKYAADNKKKTTRTSSNAEAEKVDQKKKDKEERAKVLHDLRKDFDLEQKVHDDQINEAYQAKVEKNEHKHLMETAAKNVKDEEKFRKQQLKEHQKKVKEEEKQRKKEQKAAEKAAKAAAKAK